MKGQGNLSFRHLINFTFFQADASYGCGNYKKTAQLPAAVKGDAVISCMYVKGRVPFFFVFFF